MNIADTRLISFLAWIGIFNPCCLATQEQEVTASSLSSPNSYNYANQVHKEPNTHRETTHKDLFFEPRGGSKSEINNGSLIKDHISELTKDKEDFSKASQNMNMNETEKKLFYSLYIWPYEQAIKTLKEFGETITSETTEKEITDKIYLITQKYFPQDEDVGF